MKLEPFKLPLSGTRLIEASAGTGKTHAISNLYLRAVLERELEPRRILVVTFTRAATAELGERIRARLRQAHRYLSEPGLALDDPELQYYLAARPAPEQDRLRLEQALLGIDEASVFTIHGYCQRVLEGNAFESGVGFDAELMESMDSLLFEVTADLFIQELHARPLEELAELRSHGVSFESLRELATQVGRRPELVAELLPAVVEPTDDDLEQAARGFDQLRQALRTSWDGPRIMQSIKNAKGSHKRAYSAAHLPKWLEAAALALQTPARELFGIPEVWLRLTPQALLDKGCEAPPDEPCLAQMARVCASFEQLEMLRQQRAIALRARFARGVVEALDTRKQRDGQFSFDDLLTRLAQALAGPQGEQLARRLRDAHPIALIDEFQDTDPVQYAVFSRVYSEPGTCLLLIGDPKQSIYAFRGADIEAYLAASRSAVARYSLSVNWRSDPGLLSALEEGYARLENPFLTSEIPFEPVEARPGAADLSDAEGRLVSGLEVVWLDRFGEADAPLSKADYDSLAARTAAELTREWLQRGLVLGDQPLMESQIAILTRSNSQARMTQRALSKLGLRSVQTGDETVFSAPEAADIEVLLLAMLAPGSLPALRQLLSRELLGVLPQELASWSESSPEWERWTLRVLDWGQAWRRLGPFVAIRRALDDCDVVAQTIGQLDGERRVTNLLHLAELLEQARVEQRLGPEALLAWFRDERAGDSSTGSESRQTRIESDERAVVVTTVHRSKGLQYPIVICPFLCAGIGSGRPRPSLLVPLEQPRRWGLHLMPSLLPENSPERLQLMREEMAEQTRLLYVALTRAKHAVSLCGAVAKGWGNSALGRWLFPTTSDPAELESGTAEDLVRALRERATATFRVRRLAQVGELAGSPAPRLARHLTPPVAPERILRTTRRLASYSALTRDLSGLSATGGRDRDVLTTSNKTGITTAALPWLGLPAGATTGEAIHSLFEELDFGSLEPSIEQLKLGAVLARHGLSRLDHELVRAGLRAVVGARLSETEPELRLEGLRLQDTWRELEFTFPVAKLTPERMGAVVTPALTGLAEDYTRSLQELEFGELDGHLRGFIDLVFRAGERFYVLDYKSNRLGVTAEQYGPVHLARAMAEHHYPLQASIYATAVHRWLGLRKRDYNYEQHFGGVLYLFVRGMSPELRPGHGVYHHRPSLEAVTRLSRLFEGELS